MSEVLTEERRGLTGIARLLLNRGAIMIYVVVAVLVYCMVAVPRFASVRTTGFLLLDVIPILHDRHPDDAGDHRRRDRPLGGEHGRARQRGDGRALGRRHGDRAR